MVLGIFTNGFLTALECTKCDFCGGSAPDHTGEAYNAPPDPLAGLRGTNSKGGWRKVREGEVETKGR